MDYIEKKKDSIKSEKIFEEKVHYEPSSLQDLCNKKFFECINNNGKNLNKEESLLLYKSLFEKYSSNIGRVNEEMQERLVKD